MKFFKFCFLCFSFCLIAGYQSQSKMLKTPIPATQRSWRDPCIYKFKSQNPSMSIRSTMNKTLPIFLKRRSSTRALLVARPIWTITVQPVDGNMIPTRRRYGTHKDSAVHVPSVNYCRWTQDSFEAQNVSSFSFQQVQHQLTALGLRSHTSLLFQ